MMSGLEFSENHHRTFPKFFSGKMGGMVGRGFQGSRELIFKLIFILLSKRREFAGLCRGGAVEGEGVSCGELFFGGEFSS